MKNVKFLFGLLMVVIVMTTSCKKENDDFFPYEFEDTEQTNPNQTNNNHDHETDGSLTLYRIVNNEIIKVKDFQVSSDLKSLQANTLKHQEMWDFFKKLIPENERRFISEFIVFHGGGNLAGYVTPVDGNDLSRWRMGLAIDLADDLDRVDIKDEFAYTSIHEYAHVLTLNNTQVESAVGEQSCNNYFTGEGCANADSYINRIYEIGWADIIDEFNNIQSENQVWDFYDKYADRFVTEYAATNPGEDIAEVFSVFVTMDTRPVGNTIANQKILAMYDYPELVQLRDQIRTQPVLRALKPGSWVKKGKRKMCKHDAHRHSVEN